jgi:CheY-like chemotaxis protein
MALRQLPAYAQTPVVICSGSEKEGERKPCLELGASAYRQKPTGFDPYCETLHTILQQWLPEGVLI